MCVVVVLCSAIAVVGAIAAEPDLKEMLPGIESAERSISNVEIVDFQLKSAVQEPGKVTWVEDPAYKSGSAWYSGVPDDKVRINLTHMMWHGGEGSPSISDAQLDLGYDGKIGRSAHHVTGAAGSMTDFRCGEVQAELPLFLRSRTFHYATGVLFTLNYCRMDGRSLSQRIRLSTDSGSPPHVSWQQIGDERFVCIAFGDRTKPNSRADAFWLDPSRAFSLRRREIGSVDSRGVYTLETADEVSSLKEAAPGCWYPLAASHEDQQGARRVRLQYHARNAVCNNPKFDEGVFVVRFPDGYQIVDRVRGLEYVAGVDPKDLDAHVGEISYPVHTNR